jgi:hypothetical protein
MIQFVYMVVLIVIALLGLLGAMDWMLNGESLVITKNLLSNYSLIKQGLGSYGGGLGLALLLSAFLWIAVGHQEDLATRPDRPD